MTNEIRARVQNNICINDLGVTISSTNLASDSIFVMGGFDVVDPKGHKQLCGFVDVVDPKGRRGLI